MYLYQLLNKKLSRFQILEKINFSIYDNNNNNNMFLVNNLKQIIFPSMVFVVC